LIFNSAAKFMKAKYAKMKKCRKGHEHDKRECPVCHLERANKWFNNNLDIKSEYNSKHYEKNIEKIRERSREMVRCNRNKSNNYSQ
jgi:RNA polymerase subunit RPABC4/transcription elongation factor Spt4